ncbi:MAG: methyltransferase, partial [Candidatus Bathyarchaeia archaeon]
MDEDEFSVDTLFGGALKLVQPKKGYRFSIDSLLLANFVRLRPEERLLDIGTGCGIIVLYLAKKGFGNEMVGVEIQRSLYRSAIANRELNSLPNIQFLEGDIREMHHLLRRRPFHVIVSNPPYTRARSGRKSPDTSRLLGRYELKLDLRTLLSI